MKDKSTEKLLNILNKAKNKSSLDKYISSNSEHDTYELSEYILEISTSKGYSKSDIIRNSEIYRSYGYQILNGKKSPSRDNLLKICIGNKFNLEQTNRTLTLAKLGVDCQHFFVQFLFGHLS